MCVVADFITVMLTLRTRYPDGVTLKFLKNTRTRAYTSTCTCPHIQMTLTAFCFAANLSCTI